MELRRDCSRHCDFRDLMSRKENYAWDLMGTAHKWSAIADATRVVLLATRSTIRSMHAGRQIINMQVGR